MFCMKKTLFVSSLLALGATFPLAAQQLPQGAQDDVRFNVPGATPPAAAATAPAPAQQQFTEAQMLEVFGWFLGRRAGLPELEFTSQEVASIVRGLQAAARDEDSPYDLQAIGPAMDRFMNEKQSRFMDKLRQQGLAESQAFLSQIRQKEGVVTTPSGLAYEIIDAGTGAKPKATDTVRVHYTGALVNGTVFDSSMHEGGEPVEFPLSEVLPGWTEGLQQIGTGGKIRLYVPPPLAFGDDGAPGVPPASTLIFDFELLAVNPPAAAAPAPAAPQSTKK
jgi:FKBP-type peptidyl-prolyl cis-trans isomerase